MRTSRVYRTWAASATPRSCSVGWKMFRPHGSGDARGGPGRRGKAARARVLDTADDVWGEAELVLKVKEPVAEEYHRLRRDQVLFTYLHLAASRECTQALLEAGITSVAYETVQLPDGSLPLLAPMSEVAGRMATQVAAHALERAQGGRGVLMGGVPGVKAAKVVVIGAGVSGMNASEIALGMQADVWILDKNVARLREVDRVYRGHAQTITSNLFEVEKAVVDADLVIGAVLVPGAKAPKLVTDDACGPDVPGARVAVLLCDEHARSRSAHFNVCVDERDVAVHGRARQLRLARRAAARSCARRRPEHP